MIEEISIFKNGHQEDKGRILACKYEKLDVKFVL